MPSPEIPVQVPNQTESQKPAETEHQIPSHQEIMETYKWLNQEKKFAIKAKAYDKIIAIEKEYRENLMGIKEEYEKAQGAGQDEGFTVPLSTND